MNFRIPWNINLFITSVPKDYVNIHVTSSFSSQPTFAERHYVFFKFVANLTKKRVTALSVEKILGTRWLEVTSVVDPSYFN